MIAAFALAYASLIAASGVSTADAGTEDANPPAVVANASAQALPEWTVMVYMDGDNNLEPFALSDFEEMARVNDSSQVNIVVQLDRIPGHSTRHGDWKHTLRFKLRQGMTPTPANALPPEESELAAGQETNMGHPDTLASFVEWAKRKFPANHFMLVIWDHGDGWRFLHTVSPQRNSAEARAIRMADASAADAARSGSRRSRTRSLASTISLDETLDAPHRAISMDDTDRDRLYMREVQNALEGVVVGKKLDVIGFDACLMAMVENGFAMRRVADVMVGSEELEPGNGWQYDDWLPLLVSNPNMGGVELGRKLVDSYKKTYTTLPNLDPETTLSAIDLSQDKMIDLARAISDLGDELTVSLDTELYNIRGARDSCTPYAPGRGYHGIDLHRFCAELIIRTSKPLLRARAQAVLHMLNDPSVMLNAYAGSEREGTFGSKGIAIYFPETKSAYQSDSYGSAYRDGNLAYPVEFVEQLRWDNFLHAYFERVP